MNYKDKFTGKIVKAVHIEDNIASIRKALEFIERDVPEDNSPGYAFHYTVLGMVGIKVGSYKVAHVGDYIVRYKDGVLHVLHEDEFKRQYEPMDMFIKMSINVDEYIELLEEGKRTAEKLKSIINRLNNPDIETSMEDKLSMEATIKPGKGE